MFPKASHLLLGRARAVVEVGAGRTQLWVGLCRCLGGRGQGCEREKWVAVRSVAPRAENILNPA